LTALQRAIELKPNWPFPVENYGLTLVNQGRYVEAKAHYEDALSKFPKSAAIATEYREFEALPGRICYQCVYRPCFLRQFEHCWLEGSMMTLQ
jgi:tetratricopeptide (TPR) repeat protein